MTSFDPIKVRQQIANLLLVHPELADDDVLRADCIEAETDAHEFLRMVERKRQEAMTMAGAIAGNIAELGIRQERFERREKAMRELMFKVLTTADLRKVELPEATLSIHNGQPKVIVTDEAALPDIFCKFTRAPDKTKIKEFLAENTSLPGAELSNAEPTISIRTK